MAFPSTQMSGSTPQQFSAIQNGANSGSLVSRLFAGKPASVVAGSANVKSPNFQTLSGQNVYVPPPVNTPKITTQGSTPPVHTPPPTTQPIASHTTTDSSGNSTTIKYVDPTKNAPITGDTKTPSGATVNATTGALVTPPPTFGGIVGNLANQQNSQPNQNANTATTGLLGAASGNQAIGQTAKDIAANYGKRIADVGEQAAIQGETVGGQGMLPVAMGRAQQIAQTANTAETALAQGESAALEGTGQQLTAQDQEQSGLASAGGLANTQQANAQSGLTSAGTLAQPVMGSIGQVPYSPTTGTQGSPLGAPGGTAADAARVAGQFQGAQAVAAAPGQAQASNIQTSGTAATSASASGVKDAITNYNSASTAYSTASMQSGNLQQIMAATGVNSNPQFVNQRINALQNQLGSTNYPAFITTLNETKQAYTSLLASVGAATPTVNGQQATDIFNENSTPAQINSAIDALNQAAYAKLKPMYDQIGTYQSQLTSNPTQNDNSTANPWH